MPIKASAKKELRKGAKRHASNLKRSKAMKDTVKKAQKLVAAGKIDDAKKLAPEVYQAIDKAAKSGIIKKNAAARKKSRFMRSLVASKK
jgi:small subunit ribosomal protein S20